MLKPRIADDTTENYRISKYRGTCRHCGESYYPNDRVNWNPRVKGTVCHAGCYARYGSPVVDNNATPRVPFIPPTPRPPVPVIPVTHEPVVVETENKPANSTLGEQLATAIAPYLDGRLKGMVTEEQVTQIIDKVLDGKVFKQVTTVTVVHENNITVDMGLQHKSFPDLLKACQAVDSNNQHLNVWLVGPAGTGKTTAARNVAKALELDFSFNGAISSEYQLLGFVDARGNYHGTPFRQIWEFGGVYLFDEVDGSGVPATLPFNAALANGYMTFPDSPLPVARHKDCIVIAAANTWGLGATIEYVGRNKMDAAFLDRFVQIEWMVDEQLESATCSDEAWVTKVQAWRKKVAEKGIKAMVTPRASYYGAALLQAGLTEDKVIRMTVRKGISESDWKSIN